MDILKNAHRLPVLDWNLNFFGGHYQQVANDWSVPKDKHQAFELIFILHGQECLTIEQETYRLNQGDFVLIPPGFRHTAKAIAHLTYFCFHFDLDEPNFIVQLIQNSPVFFSQSDKINQKIRPILVAMVNLVSPSATYSFNDKMQIQIYLSQLLMVLNQLIPTKTASTNANQSRYAKIIAETLKSTLNEAVLHPIDESSIQISIADLMATIGISEGYGNRLFKEAYGFSPQQYLSTLKLKWAKKMLLKPQFSVGEIAQTLGYQNASHFSRQFKRWTSMSPKTYRQIVAKN
ncbi:AraC family transcriptional regulator [Lactiplantibacillus pentosus]|uniref:AraC family transcriptional regulator n=1 Tax=Lactiplantibacillus pentosus TaxID=1589 RepID=A0AB37REB3_LACPE|nr:AraC family transcriptional regulator [Lactiplantibacillus pentosus]RMW42371.1 AraC family transcriptional regulator [Lactiplantibacillus pentosus]RMW48459.1 AraC family transcriptional regulator [Lactiplantibacillus pentosus]RMW52596.1 AraC family transcriptional regulator [Lactiplantibacillus pentosus]RMW55330.1 AraC family transcriptional regulator [Lactiplantibacillus pentosus]